MNLKCGVIGHPLADDADVLKGLEWGDEFRKFRPFQGAIGVLDDARFSGAFGDWKQDAQSDSVPQKIALRPPFELEADFSTRISSNQPMPNKMDFLLSAFGSEFDLETFAVAVGGRGSSYDRLGFDSDI